MTRGTRLKVVSLFIFAGNSAALARAQDETGFEASVRGGYAIALGKATGPGGDLNDAVAGQVPLILDVGVRVLPNMFIGVFGQYGFGILGGQLSESCDQSSEVSCDATDVRVGLEGHYHFQPGEQLDPWIGFGLGYEWLTLSVEGGGLALTTRLSGFEYFNLQGGLDIVLAPHFRVGPFLGISLDEYASQSVECSGPSDFQCQAGVAQSGSVPSKALHEWLMFGVRATFGP
jgi:hypothetical protein